MAGLPLIVAAVDWVDSLERTEELRWLSKAWSVASKHHLKPRMIAKAMR